MQYKVFGCKVNKYYTDRWLNSEYLRDKTGTFVASCVVTDSAKRKWIRFVKKELTSLENGKIFISGCGAFKDGKAQDDFFELYPELASAKEKIEILDEAPIEDTNNTPPPAHAGIPLIEGEHIQSPSSREMPEGQRELQPKIDISKLKTAQQTQIYTKKFILIQGGCDSFCTFCLTVQKRGRHYFRAAEDIVEEIIEFENTGGKEVVLTGVNLSAWGLGNTHNIKNFSPDLIKNGEQGQGSRFAELLSYVLENTSIPRIRISSLGPEFIDEKCLKIFQNERIYPHFHFSIQSGSSKILKSMARHYDGDYMRQLLKKLRDIQREDGVDISIGADMIVGFPGETEEDFMDSYALVQEYKISKLHAFPFSAHTMGESVPAGKFQKQVTEDVKKDRMNRLMNLAETIRDDFKKSQKGKVLKVLIEKSSQDSWSGWTENYLEADTLNFEIIAGTPKKNHIIVGKFL